jgi:hypothetical protein
MATDWPQNYDHHDEDQSQDPWPMYKEIREQCPVMHVDKHGGYWVFSRYEDVGAAARDPETFSSKSITIPHMGGDAARPMIPIELDPPEHLKFRHLTQQVFSPGYLAKWDPFVTAVANDNIDAFAQRGEAELIDELAVPIPMTVFTEMLGTPHSDHDLFKDWSIKLVQQHHLSPELQMQTAQEVQTYFSEQVAERRRRSELGTDLISILCGGKIDGRPLTTEEIVDYCFLLVLAGNETTTNAMGASLYWLATHPEMKELLIEDPSRVPTFVEEVLRYFSVVQGLSRTATRDVEVQGQAIKQGDPVMLCWAAADHDPEQFSNPDEFIWDREPNLHYAFGAGNHRCLGSNLGRQELRIMLWQVLQRIPDFRLAEGAELRWYVGATRGLYQLPVVFTPES